MLQHTFNYYNEEFDIQQGTFNSIQQGTFNIIQQGTFNIIQQGTFNIIQQGTLLMKLNLNINNYIF
jgi:hypothetical protein